MRTKILVVTLILIMSLIVSPIILCSASVNISASEKSLIQIISPNENFIDDKNVTIIWKIDPSIEYYTIWIDGKELGNEINIANESITLELEDGPHHVTILAGSNTAAYIDNTSFFVDTSYPELNIYYPHNESILNTSNVTINWKAFDTSSIVNVEIEISLDNEPLVIDSKDMDTNNDTFTLYDLEDGDYEVSITVTDGSGKHTQQAIEFSIDNTVPTIEIISPSDDIGIYDNNITIEWLACDEGDNIIGYDIYVNRAYHTTVAPSTNLIHFSHLMDGEYVVEVIAIDSANNTARSNISFTVDTEEFMVINTSPTNDALKNVYVSIEYSKDINQDASNILLSNNNKLISGVVNWDGNVMTFTPDTPLELGITYEVYTTAVDYSGKRLDHKWAFNTTTMSYVSGLIKNADGTPLTDARVYILGTNGPSTMTDEQGHFRIKVSPGNQTLSISKSGYVTRSIPINTLPGDEKIMNPVQLTSTELIVTVGWIVAIIATIFVIAIYYFKRGGKERHRMIRLSVRSQGKETSRSWKRMEEPKNRYRR